MAIDENGYYCDDTLSENGEIVFSGINESGILVLTDEIPSGNVKELLATFTMFNESIFLISSLKNLKISVMVHHALNLNISSLKALEIFFNQVGIIGNDLKRMRCLGISLSLKSDILTSIKRIKNMFSNFEAPILVSLSFNRIRGLELNIIVHEDIILNITRAVLLVTGIKASINFNTDLQRYKTLITNMGLTTLGNLEIGLINVERLLQLNIDAQAVFRGKIKRHYRRLKAKASIIMHGNRATISSDQRNEGEIKSGKSEIEIKK